MIYSTFPFSQDFHLLDLKIEEEINTIDKMIIVESNLSFSGYRKNTPLWNKGKNYPSKVEIKLFDAINTPKTFPKWAWNIEDHQRNFALPEKINNDDLFFIGDVDWILHRDDFDFAIKVARDMGFISIFTEVHYFYINVKSEETANFYCVRGDILKKDFNSSLGNLHGKHGYFHLENLRSKHFGMLQDVKGIQLKLMCTTHQEWNHPKYTSFNAIESKRCGPIFEDPLARGHRLKAVEIDETYPPGILNNRAAWEKWTYDPGCYWKS